MCKYKPFCLNTINALWPKEEINNYVSLFKSPLPSHHTHDLRWKDILQLYLYVQLLVPNLTWQRDYVGVCFWIGDTRLQIALLIIVLRWNPISILSGVAVKDKSQTCIYKKWLCSSWPDKATMLEGWWCPLFGEVRGVCVCEGKAFPTYLTPLKCFGLFFPTPQML